MSTAPDGYDADTDSRRTFELYWRLKRAELQHDDSRAGQYPVTRSENPVMPSALMLREARTSAGNSSEAKTGQSAPADRAHVVDPTPAYRANADRDAAGAGGSPAAIHAVRAALVAAMLRHYVPGAVAAHPEIDAAFCALVMTRPVRACEVGG